MLRRIRNLVIKEFLQLARNKLLAPLILLGPLIEMSLIAWATSAPITDLPTVVVDLDRSGPSRALLTTLENTDTFGFDYALDSPAQVPDYLESGRAVAAVVIPADYSQRLADPVLSGPPEVALVLDGSKPTSAREALNSARGAIEAVNMARSLRGERREAEALSPVRPHLRVRYNEEMKESVYTLPSELGQILFAVALVLAGISIARERELGTLEHLMVAPIRRVELIIAKSVPAVLLSYLVFLSMLAVSILVFEVPMRGSWLLLLPISLLFIFIELGIGLMISSYAKNQTQGMLLALMWAMIEFFFSGYGVPVENMPVILQTIAPIFPIYHYMTIFRAILLKGVGVSAFWPHLLAAFIIGTVVLSVTVWFLGRQEWD